MLFYSIPASAKVTLAPGKDDVVLLKSRGLALGKDASLLLNQHMKKKKIKKNAAYRVGFVCQHKDNFEKCELYSLDYK